MNAIQQGRPDQRNLSDQGVAVIIPTFNAGLYLEALTRGLEDQRGLLPSQVIVIDSSSKDSTVEHFRRWGARVHIIPQAEFDHGGTRRFAATLAESAEFLVFLTQDAILADACSIERLLEAFQAPSVGIVRSAASAPVCARH